MGTNFYFKVKTDIQINIPIDGEIKNSILEKLNYALQDVTEIHIGKRSGGWLPLFQKTNYYSSVKEIKEFYEKNKEHLIIIDEYDMEYSLDELDEEIFSWNKGNPDAKTHLDLNDFRNDSNYGPSYYTDSEGYEFTATEFS